MPCCGQGAAYQLAERARGGEDAAVEVMCGALLGAAEETGLRGLHGCAEHRMRAAHYGLGAAGSAAVPRLLELLRGTVWEHSPSACVARRALHALGDADEQPTAQHLQTVVDAYDGCCAELERYVGTLADWPMAGWDEEAVAAGPRLFEASTLAEVEALPAQAAALRKTGTAGTIQHEPSDEHGAELHMAAASAMQCLSAWAERVAATDDVDTAAAMVPVLTACILGPEPGFQFEARHGTHAREVAAQALLKLCCGTASTRSDFTPVAATAMNGAMHSSFVTALVAEGFRRCASSPKPKPPTLRLLARLSLVDSTSASLGQAGGGCGSNAVACPGAAARAAAALRL